MVRGSSSRLSFALMIAACRPVAAPEPPATAVEPAVADAPAGSGGATPAAVEPDTGAAIDTDADGVPDADDRCPTSSETPNGDADEDGCPDERAPQLVKLGEHAALTRRVHFDHGSARLRPGVMKLLEGMRAELAGTPEIRIEVVGHTEPGEARTLGLKRAEAVRDWFVAKGVASERVEVRNEGADVPYDTNRSAVGRARNRRVQLAILP